MSEQRQHHPECNAGSWHFQFQDPELQACRKQMTIRLPNPDQPVPAPPGIDALLEEWEPDGSSDHAVEMFEALSGPLRKQAATIRRLEGAIRDELPSIRHTPDASRKRLLAALESQGEGS